MDKRSCSRGTQDRNGQGIRRGGALRGPAVSCPACPSFLINRRGQQVREYVVLISAVALAMIVMYGYSKRGIQAVIKQSTDQMGSQAENEPVAGSIKTRGNSTATTLTSEVTHINKTGDERRYNYDVSSTSQGVSLTHTEEY